MCESCICNISAGKLFADIHFLIGSIRRNVVIRHFFHVFGKRINGKKNASVCSQLRIGNRIFFRINPQKLCKVLCLPPGFSSIGRICIKGSFPTSDIADPKASVLKHCHICNISASLRKSHILFQISAHCHLLFFFILFTGLSGIRGFFLLF